MKQFPIGRALSATAFAAAIAINASTPSRAAFTATAPSTTQVSLIADATCEQQLDNVVIGLTSGAFAADAIGLASEVIGELAQPLTNPASSAGVAAQGAALVLTIAAYGFDEDRQAQLPYCEETFAGSVQVTSGGASITGDSIFNNNLAVGGNLSVAGAISGNSVDAATGISAHNGALWIGNADGLTFQTGISIGGGAFAGAGTGGLASTASHVDAIAIGNGSTSTSAGGIALGKGANSAALDAVAFGTNARATQSAAIAIGHNAAATGAGSIAIGRGASATGSVAIGAGASAANGGAALGDNTTATGFNSTAAGPGAVATFSNSAAFGNGAVATLSDQQVFGTTSNSYTMPGITSPMSESRQVGNLELVMTDSFGNLAGDGGSTFATIAKVQAGVAVSLATEAPSLTAEEDFGIRFGWGNFNGTANAVGGSAIGVVCRDCLTTGDRVAIDASIGAGWSEYRNQKVDNIAGGRVGVQVTW